MPTLTGSTQRLELNQSSRVGTKELLSGEKLTLWQGLSARVECALFNDTPEAASFVDLSNINAIDLVARKNGPNGDILFSESLDVGDLDLGTTYAAWLAGTASQFVFELTELDTTQIVPQSGKLPIYFVVTVTTSDNVPYVAGFGFGEIVDVGYIENPVSSDYVTGRTPIVGGKLLTDLDLNGFRILDTQNQTESGEVTLTPGQVEGDVVFQFDKTTPNNLRFARKYVKDTAVPPQLIEVVIGNVTSTGFHFYLSATATATTTFVWKVEPKDQLEILGTPSPRYGVLPAPDSVVEYRIYDRGGQFFNVKAYGAVGDGTTDDTIAIQSAIAAAGAANGTVFFPPTYAGSPFIVSTLNVNVGIKLFGGDAATNGTRLQSNTNAVLLNITAPCTLENLSLVGTGNPAHTSQDLIVITDMNGVHIRNCFITHGYNLLRYQGTCFYCYVDNTRFGESVNSALRTVGSGTSGQQVQLHGCNFLGAGVRTNYVMLLDNVGSIMLSSCIINHSNTVNGGIFLNSIATLFGGFRITGCDVELEDALGNGPALAIIGASGIGMPKNVQVSNSYFGAGNLTGAYAVELGYLTQSSFTNCIFTAPGRGIHILNDVTGVTFISCDFPTTDLPVVSDGASGTANIDRIAFIGCKYVGSSGFLTLSPANVGNLIVRDSSIGNSPSNISMPTWSSGKRVSFQNCWIGDGAGNYKVFVQYPWTAPTLLNSWANIGGLAPAGYMKDDKGIVHLRGIVSGGTLTGGTQLFQLPVGFRPGNAEYFRTINGNQLNVDANGFVNLDTTATGAVSFSGMSFDAN